MALRKDYQLKLEESAIIAKITALNHQPDNGLVGLTDAAKKNIIILTYNDIAHLYAAVFPEKSYQCGVGEVYNFATLTNEEREAYYQAFPETRPEAVEA